MNELICIRDLEAFQKTHWSVLSGLKTRGELVFQIEPIVIKPIVFHVLVPVFVKTS